MYLRSVLNLLSVWEMAPIGLIALVSSSCLSINVLKDPR